MNVWIVIIIALIYLLLLFGIAYFSERNAAKGKSISSNPYIYALSMAVFCTAWTFYGSVGRAATSGVGFLPVYLGPTLTAPLWLIILRKIILISKREKITSIADFISARYGKGTSLGVLATVVAVFGIIPYISIQLKAIAISFQVLTNDSIIQIGNLNTGLDTSQFVAILLGAFTILFGARHLEATETHEGLISAIAFESVIKLIAFVSVGFFVTFFVYDGFGDVFDKALQNDTLQGLFTLQGSGIDAWEWTWLMLLSMFAILLLPRQFHVSVVENTNSKHINKAMWLFPLYLLIINLFVLPIAFGGYLHFGGNTNADMFVLDLPLFYNQKILALVVFIGGLSAATSMVIVATIALSIMISNNIVVPTFLKVSPYNEEEREDTLSVPRLLLIRRLSIVLVLFIAYAYYKAISEEYALVSIGLMSFAAVAQFAPSLIGGIYWKRATRKGAFWGLLIGFLVWGFTLPLPTLAEVGIIPNGFIENGLFGQYWLKPRAFLGLTDSSPISLSAFWSLFFNLSAFISISLFTTPSPIEHKQANIFVDIYKYTNETLPQDVIKRTALLYDVQILVNRFLGKQRGQLLLEAYAKENQLDLAHLKIIDSEFIGYIENALTGAIGAASARILLASIVKEDPISLDEVMGILDETQQIMKYSRALEQTTLDLKAANERLKELDTLKDDFITTVTHELRTPITSIKALSKIIYDNSDLDEVKQKEFLGIIVSESERITRLINQVLDLEKIELGKEIWNFEKLNFTDLVNTVFDSFIGLAKENQVQLGKNIIPKKIFINGDKDKLQQVIVNLLSNAMKFCNTTKGQVKVILETVDRTVTLKVIDNGKGISKRNQAIIFDRFTQINDTQEGKPKGSGLGLSISKTIVEQHKGDLFVSSEPNNGAVFILKLPIID